MTTEHETVGDVLAEYDHICKVHSNAGWAWLRDSMGRIKRAHARESAAQVGVPEGWVLVPREPTQAMLTVMRFGDNIDNRKTYSALLSAAPAPAAEPEPKPVPEADEPGCDDCDGYEGEGGHCLMCGKDLGAAPQPAPSDAPASPQAAQGDVEALAWEAWLEVVNDPEAHIGRTPAETHRVAVEAVADAVARRLASAQPATAKPAAEFKLGDRVKYTNMHGHCYTGMVTGYRVEFDDDVGYASCAQPSSLTRLTGGAS